MNKIFKNFGFGVLLIILGITLFVCGFTSKEKGPINNLYKVYLEGKEIGVIKSKSELENYINNKQEELKKKFGVENVYPPNGLDIVEYKTYNNKTFSVKDVYNKIGNIKPFTIKGYIVNIKSTENPKTLYVINKDYFTNAVKKVINTFVDKDSYNLYMEGNQVNIKETGSIIEDLYIQEKITIKESNINVNEHIFLNEEDLTKQLLFGTTEKQKTYIVQKGDNINDVSFNNQLNPDEFLIANPEFTNVNNLLYEGKEVVIGLINPQFSVVVKNYTISDKERMFTTEIQYDKNASVGSNITKVAGENGLDRVSQKITYVNGEITTVDTVSLVELKPAVNSIVVKGSKTSRPTNLGIVEVEGSWAWPTQPGYMITCNYGWRWGKMHYAIDISGTGHGSNIYAANNGVVIKLGTFPSFGKMIVIDHGNGIITEYAHLDSYKVKLGDRVSYGQTIGGMGNTGFSTGTHLHFSVWKNAMQSEGGIPVNPLSLYR